MLKNIVRLGAATGCAYAAYLCGVAGTHYPVLFLPAAACGTGAALLGYDGARDLLNSVETEG